ncbi:hypothetical protein [Yersinia intermedia]|uniref:hypothetical protein n=1 Tax=Yersinia intermedia TaxID=631 RepID=UPI000B70908F|nr:hypothetical protein [Yersinia intermedia]MCW8110149.1 hypothetical protein [Yersinia intermedia]MDA5515132.1 hypothetical protein [Yersinia intermedia]OWF90437.1 hypothetical protein B4916_15810 [Yersinia intermedia]
MAYYLVRAVNNYAEAVNNHKKGFIYSLALAKEVNSNVRVLFPSMQNANSQFLAEAIGPDVAHKLCGSRAKKVSIENVEFSASWLDGVKSRQACSEKVFLVIIPQLIEIESLTKTLGTGIEMIVVEHHAEPGELKRWAAEVKAKNI